MPAPKSAAERSLTRRGAGHFGDLHPASVSAGPRSGDDLDDDYSSEPPSVTAQSHVFQKIVGARIDGSIPSTRSLTAVTSGNW